MRVVLLGCFVAALMVVASGCGGDESPSASEQWAGSVCTSMGDWATRMQGYADDVQAAITSPSADSVATIQSAIAKGADATDQMVADLDALEPPPTSDGESARSLLDSFTSELQEAAKQVQDAAQAIERSSSATDVGTALATIATEVSAAIAKGQTTFQSLREVNEELQDAFANVDSCQQLQEDFG
jgi:uncharacterized phage infection (PIP) family protein YhgE